MMKKAILLVMALTFAQTVWALDSVDAIDQAVVQLIQDGSQLEHEMAQKSAQSLNEDDLKTLASKLEAYEKQVGELAREAKLNKEALNQPGYEKLLNDSVRLSETAVALSSDLSKLADKVEGDSAKQYQNTFETMTRSMLRLSDDIGVMADRILFTEEQIGIMADRIGEMADRILETQRIQNENIARVQATTNRVIAKLALPKPDMTVLHQEHDMQAAHEAPEMMQQGREAMMEQKETQQQMQEMKAQQQETQEQMQQFRAF